MPRATFAVSGPRVAVDFSCSGGLAGLRWPRGSTGVLAAGGGDSPDSLPSGLGNRPRGPT